MNTETTFETLDWNAEARRVARAFGVTEECHFHTYVENEPIENGDGDYPYLRLTLKDGLTEPTIFCRDDVALLCEYDEDIGRSYYVYAEKGVTGIRMEWDESLASLIKDSTLLPLLAKGLFYLDILTPEVEETLKITVTAHEKLEWAREYEQRYGL